MVSERDAAHLLAGAGALKRGGASGATVALDTCRLSSSPASLQAVVGGLAERLRPILPADCTLVSPNTASLPLATLVATTLALPLAYLRPKPKGHGKQRQVEGVLPEGGSAVLLFDAIDDADMLREAIGIVERHGATVGAVAGALVSDAAALAAVFQASGGLPLVALTDVAQATTALEAAGPAAAPPRETPPGTPMAAPSDADRQALKIRVARALLGIGAVTINAAQPYRYTSGILSPIYTDNRLLISHPDAWGEIVDGFSSAVAGIARDHGLDALAGAATAGVPHAARISQRLGIPMLYVDLGQQDDGDGQPGRLCGSLAPGDRLVIVEDLVTTGKSVIEFAEALTARGAQVGWCVAIFTYDVAGAQATFAARGLAFEALCDIDTLLDVAVQDGSIRTEDRAAVHEWLADRNGWSNRAEARLAAANPA